VLKKCSIKFNFAIYQLNYYCRDTVDWSFYVFSGTEEEIPCPAGTYNPEVKGSSITSCRPCDAGSYCLEKAKTPNGPCDKGFYCPTNITDGVSTLIIGSYGPQQVPCPPKTYRNSTGGKTVDECHRCPGTNYCPQGSELPKPCPRGYYCPPEVSEPQPCPIGTYGDRAALEAIEECTNCTKGWYVCTT
jgi:hypothetical protein